MTPRKSGRSAEGAGTGTPALRGELRGRVAELATLYRLLADARSGMSGALVLRGEEGIGKTALLQRAVETAADMRVSSIVGIEPELQIHLAGLHRLLAPFLDGLAELPAPRRDALAAAFGLTGGASADSLLVGLGALALLARTAERQPLLLVVDDAQWLDQRSAESLAFVARRLAGEGIALVFASSTPPEIETPLDGLPELRVEGLPEDAARELLAEAVAGPLDGHVVDRILVETGGNPLALRELAATLSPGQLAGTSPLPEPLPLPARLDRSFVERFRRLPAETQELLFLAAAEPDLDALLFSRAADRLGLPSAAIAAADQLLRLGPQITFRQPLLRAAIYEAALPAERERVHRALASSFDGTTHPDRRAWHTAAATVGLDEHVAGELERAVPRAKNRAGFAAAAALLERAAELTSDPGRRARRRLAAAQAALQAGTVDKASAILADVASQLPDELQRAQAERLRGALALAVGSDGGSSATLLRAARAFVRLDMRLARDTHLEALEAAMYEGRLGGRAQIAEAAQAVRALAPVRASRATAADLLLEGFAALMIDGHAAAAPALRRAIGKLRSRGELRWVGLGYIAAFELWEDDALQALASRRVQLARKSGALTALPNALGQLGGYEVVAGRFDAAEECFEEGRRVAAATGSPGLMGGADPGALIVAAWRGREAETRALAEACARDAAARGIGVFVGFAQHALAVLELGLGHYEAALAAAQEASAHELVSTRTLPELVEAAVRSGQQEIAASAVSRLAESAHASGTEWGLGMLARSRALLADRQAAESLYEKALDHLKGCRVTPQLARARLVYGEWLRRQRRRRDARTQLRAAYEMLAAMGAGAFAERAGIELFATGERVVRRTFDPPLALTPHEARIGRLVSEGRSNAEIGGELFISPRTVEYHLTKIYKKLGVGSRTQLARALLERDR